MAPGNGFKNRKKLNLQVKREFQRWLLRQVLVTVGVCALIAAAILYFYARQEVVGSFFDAHVKLRRVSDLLLPVVLAGSLVSLLAGGLLALFLPQKIAGPIFRIEKGLQAVDEGDLTARIQLRTEDTLQDLAQSVSHSVDSVRQRVHEAKEGFRALEKAIAAGDTQQLAPLAEQLRRQLEQLKT